MRPMYVSLSAFLDPGEYPRDIGLSLSRCHTAMAALDSRWFDQSLSRALELALNKGEESPVEFPVDFAFKEQLHSSGGTLFPMRHLLLGCTWIGGDEYALLSVSDKRFENRTVFAFVRRDPSFADALPEGRDERIEAPSGYRVINLWVGPDPS